MGASSKEFMKVRMLKDDYMEVPPEVRQRMEIMYVDVEGYDYTHDELWSKLDAEANKAYKAKKKREFELRHNIKK